MSDWTLAGMAYGPHAIIVAYFCLTALALFLQHLRHKKAMKELVLLHKEHTDDLSILIDVLQAALEVEQRLPDNE